MLTTLVSNGAADALLELRLASRHHQNALLHHARRVVSDAVTQLAGLAGLAGHLWNTTKMSTEPEIVNCCFG